MIELYYWPTPNGHKITLFLEETGLPYRLSAVNIGTGDQFKPVFLEKSPNNRIPAIVDYAPTDGGEPISVFESGAILVYLGDKTGAFLPTAVRDRKVVLEWLFWQVGGLGPMAGQSNHFNRYAPVQVPYAIERYNKETNRLYGVLDRRLAGGSFVAGSEYSIADMAIYPWIAQWEMQRQNLEDFPELQRWFKAIAERPATIRAYAAGEPMRAQAVVTDEHKKVMFGQTSASLGPR